MVDSENMSEQQLQQHGVKSSEVQPPKEIIGKLKNIFMIHRSAILYYSIFV